MTKTSALPRALLSPATVTLLASLALVTIVIAAAGGDPLALARLGTRYSLGDPNGSEGYDGQFVYYIARDPDPDTVAPYLDTPAYRYQRILLPLLGRLFSLGSLEALPWALAVIGLLTHMLGTWAVGRLLERWGVSRWYALVYGLWVGFLLAVRLDLPEPLAYGLVTWALLLAEKNDAGASGRSPFLSWLLYGLALFAKEVTIFFLAAQLLYDLSRRRWRDALGLTAVALLPYALFQGWLWVTFGEPGVGSGGAMATPFEWLPFMGIGRIGAYSQIFFAAILVVYTPFIIFPTLWGLWVSAQIWLADERHVVVLALALNAAAIPFLPFSTYREPGGMLRFASGLVLATLLFAGRFRMTRALNYSLAWLALNAILLN